MFVYFSFIALRATNSFWVVADPVQLRHARCRQVKARQVALSVRTAQDSQNTPTSGTFASTPQQVENIHAS